MGWTARQLALLYSEEIGREDNPVDPTFIYWRNASWYGYQILAADVVAEQNPVAAASLLGQTVVLAKQERLQNFYVHALRQRAQTGISQFELTRDPAILKQSLYRTDPETARFGVALLKAQRPELF